MFITTIAQSIDLKHRYEDQFTLIEAAHKTHQTIAKLKGANICIYSFGILVGRLEYEIRDNRLYPRNFNRQSINRFEKAAMRRYGLDQYWQASLTNV